MAIDVREEMQRAAITPEVTPLQLEFVARRAWRLRFRRVLLVTCIAVALVAGVTVFELRPQQGDGRVVVPPASRSAHGTTRVTSSAGELTLVLPGRWKKTPNPAGTMPIPMISVGTTSVAPPQCLSDKSAPVGTWLTIYEYTNYQDGASLPAPDRVSGYPAWSAANVHDRPASFLQPDADLAEWHCDLGKQAGARSATAAVTFDRLFRDSGRVFLARVTTTEPPTGTPNPDAATIAARREALAVLNTLHVGTTPTESAAGLPAPSAPTDQEQVPLDRADTPIAVGGGKVWVAGTAGVEIYDPKTLEHVATVPTSQPPVTMAWSAEGLWVVTGPDTNVDNGSTAPYSLVRIAADGDQIEFSTTLPVHASYRSNGNLRLAATPGTAWVAFASTVFKVDAATGTMTPISLGGAYAGNIAANASGLWLAGAGTDGTGNEFTILHIDASTGHQTTIPGIRPGFMWSIAATDNAAWLAIANGTPKGGPGLHLVRIDDTSHEVASYAIPAIAVVTDNTHVWVQPYSNGNTLSQATEIDTTNGKPRRTISISLGPLPASASNGYTFPPFAVADNALWSAYNGLQKTTTAP